MEAEPRSTLKAQKHEAPCLSGRDSDQLHDGDNAWDGGSREAIGPGSGKTNPQPCRGWTGERSVTRQGRRIIHIGDWCAILRGRGTEGCQEYSQGKQSDYGGGQGGNRINLLQYTLGGQEYDGATCTPCEPFCQTL